MLAIIVLKTMAFSALPNMRLKLTVSAQVRLAWLAEVLVFNNFFSIMNSFRLVYVESFRRGSLAAIR
jgi:hypothetical protein